MNNYLIWYLDIHNDVCCAMMHGPNWHKAWSHAVYVGYMNGGDALAVTLLKVETTDATRTVVYESPYRTHIMENNEYVQHIFEQLAVQKDSPFGECLEHGS